MAAKTVEESVLYLPITENDVSWLGDLWDCRTSIDPKVNLFKQEQLKLKIDELVDICPTPNSSYTLRHIKKVEDKLTSLHVDASISFELLSGMLKVAGGASFDKENEKNFKEEELFCQLKETTFVIRLRSELEEIVHRDVKDQILAGTLKATHFVKEIQLGADVLGSIRINDNLDDSSMGLSGHFEGKFLVGPLTVGIKASLEWLEHDKKSSYSTKVVLTSRPHHDQPDPTNIVDMFKCISEIDEQIKKPYRPNFFEPGRNIYGQPIRFKLAPITDLFPTEQIPKYQVMDEETQKEFLAMMLTIYDFGVKGHVRAKLREADARLRGIFESYIIDSGILDPNRNPLTKDVIGFEEGLAKQANLLMEETKRTFQNYKTGDASAEDIKQLIQKYKDEFNLDQVLSKIGEYLKQGKRILNDVHAADASLTKKPDLFIKSEEELRDWFEPEGDNIKILLSTNANGEYTEGVFLKLFTIIPALEPLGVVARVAFPNILDDFSLQIKINHEVHIYPREEVSFFLDILSVAIGKGGRSALLFYSTLGIMGLAMPISIENINLYVQVLARESNGVVICETYAEFVEALLTGDGGQWKFILPIQAIMSTWEMTWAYREIRSTLTKFPDIPHQWIVAHVNPSAEDWSNGADGPLLYVFRNNQLRAICLDHLDLYILIHQLTTYKPSYSLEGETENDVDLSVLESVRANCFYPPRANFALQVVQNISLDHRTSTLGIVKPMPSFDGAESEPPVGFTAALAIIQSACTNHVLEVAATIGNLCLQDFPRLKPMLKRYGWNELTGFTNVADLDDWSQLSEELHHFIEEQKGPELKRIRLRRQNDILKVKSKEEDEDISEGLEDFFNLGQLRDISKSMGSEKPINIGHICLNYLSTERLVIDKDVYPELIGDIIKAIESGQFYKALGLLNQRQYDKKLFKFISDLSFPEQINDFRNGAQMGIIVKKMKTVYNFSAENVAAIWMNPKFGFWMCQGLQNDTLMATIESFLCEDGIPSYLPAAIAERVRHASVLGGMNEDLGGNFYWPIKWNTIDDVIQAFQIICAREELPAKEFPSVLRNNMDDNSSLRAEMLKLDALYYWNDKDKYVEEPWSLGTVKMALGNLMKLENTGEKSESSKSFPTLLLAESDNMENAAQPILVNKIWTKFTGGSLPTLIAFENLSILNPMANKPMINLNELSKTTGLVFPYLAQEIRMNNIIAFAPAQIANYINYRIDNTPGQIEVDEKQLKRKLRKLKIVENNNDNFFMARDDYLTALMTSTDPILVNYILSRISEAPIEMSMALPLIIQDITIDSPDKFQPVRLLFEVLQTLSIPEYDLARLLPQSHPFVEPYRFIVNIRIGEAPIGKSTILNKTIMGNDNFFACKNEQPDSSICQGSPVSRNGLVEVTWLSETTSHPTLWKRVVQPHYGNSKGNELILLANMHGDALGLGNVLRLLAPLTTCFVVFWTSPNWKDMISKQKSLMAHLGENQACLHMVIDPDKSLADKVGSLNIIRTANLEYEEQEKMRLLVDNAIGYKRTAKPKIGVGNAVGEIGSLFLPSVDEITNSSIKSQIAALVSAPTHVTAAPPSLPTIATPESLALIGFIEEKGVFAVKMALRLDLDLDTKKQALTLFRKLLALPPSEKAAAMTHFLSELEHLSGKSSYISLQRLLTLEDQLNGVKKYTKISQSRQRHIQSGITGELQDELKSAIAKLNSNSLQVLDFFRSMSQSQSTQDKYDAIYFNQMFEHIDAGFAMELFNDDGVMWSQGMQFCFEKLMGKYGSQDMRIFVLSTVGLQGANKSTLLNRLFGKSFREGVAARTEGIFIRLLNLEPELKKELLIDRVILLDVEGVRSAHNWFDEETRSREIQLMAFVLGLSHLTFVSSDSDSLADLKDPLLITLLSSFRIPNTMIIPEVLLIHGENFATVTSEVDKPNMLAEFTEIICSLKLFTNTAEFEIGTRNNALKGLEKINARLASPHQSDFTIESTHRIYTEILETIMSTQMPTTLGEWYDFSAKYWKCIEAVETPSKYRSLEHYKAELEREQKISKIKELTDAALQKHGKEIKKEYLAAIGNDNIPNKPKILQGLTQIPSLCKQGTTDGNRCSDCEKVVEEINYSALIFQDDEFVESIRSYMNNVREQIRDKCIQMGLSKEIKDGIPGELSLALDAILEEFENHDVRWNKFKQLLSTKLRVISGHRSLDVEIRETYANFPHMLMERLPIQIAKLIDQKHLMKIPAFINDFKWSYSPLKSNKPDALNWKQNRWLVVTLQDLTESFTQKLFNAGDPYQLGVIRQFCELVKKVLADFEKLFLLKLLPDFKTEIHIYALEMISDLFDELWMSWNAENNLLILLENKRDIFPEIFNVERKLVSV